MPSISDEHRELLERMGEHAVRMHVLAGSLAPFLQVPAVNWLAELDRVQSAKDQTAAVENARVAIAAKDAAIVAARAAIATLVLTVIAIAISIVAWLFPRP